MKKFEEFVVQKLMKIEADIATLKVKSGIWGMIGGGVIILLSIGLGFLKSSF